MMARRYIYTYILYIYIRVRVRIAGLGRDSRFNARESTFT